MGAGPGPLLIGGDLDQFKVVHRAHISKAKLSMMHPDVS